ncbi:MAG: hypothetical protein Q8Q49_06595 [bacterium]|nr:hypothetical protein [bacterium]
MEKFSRNQSFVLLVLIFLSLSIFLNGTFSSWLTLFTIILLFFAWYSGNKKSEKI